MPQALATVPGGLEDTQTVPGVATDTPEYYCLLTKAGAVLEAAAHAAGKPVRLSVIAVGDGNHAPFYKARSVLGQATTHELSVPVIMSGTAEVQIIVSESGYASRLELLQIAGVVEDLRHPREAVWTLDEAVEDGGTLTLPEGVAYLPGEHLLDVFWDGVACYPGQQYEEISSADALESTAIRLLFAAPAGSEMRVLVRAYSIQPELEGVEVPEGIAERVDALETRLEDVAANVAYVEN